MQYQEPSEKSDKRWLGVGIGIFVLIVGIVGGVGYIRQLVDTSARLHDSTQNNQQVSVSEESEKPVVESQSYTVRILNGSGVTGAAARSAEELGNRNQELVITTGNAERQLGDTLSYRNEELSRGSLAVILTKIYPEAKVSVDEKLDVDIEVILGK